MFTVNTDDIQFLFDSAGETVLINDVERQVIISNPSITEYDQKYIHSIEPVLQGDLVTLNNEKYLVITETVNNRSIKYKALMRHCNYIIEIPVIIHEIMLDENGNPVLDQFGDPVYHDVQGEPILVPSIIDNKNFTIDGQQIRVGINQIIVLIQDNATNRDKFQVNNTFNFEGEYKVLNRDFTKRGIIILTCESAI